MKSDICIHGLDIRFCSLCQKKIQHEKEWKAKKLKEAENKKKGD